MTTRDKWEHDAPLATGIEVLEASAGTGKTWTIESLVQRLVADEDKAIGRILVVTFTIAATSELVRRVRSRLKEATSENGGDPERLARLQRALVQFDEASIFTIHGFCQRALEQNAFESRVSFDAELIEDVEDLLKELATDFHINEVHDLPPTVLRHMQATRCGIRDYLEIAARLDACPRATILPPAVPNRVVPDPTAYDAVVAVVAARWAAESEAFEAALRPHVGGLLPDKTYGLTYAGRDKLESAFASVAGWLEQGAPLGHRPNASAEVLCRERLERFGLTSIPPLAACLDDLLTEARALLPGLLAYSEGARRRFADWVTPTMDRRKQRRNQQSFSDLLVRLHDALHDPDVAAAIRDGLRDRFDAILIDEFQDTDPVQWEIFRTAFEGAGCPVYLIGDPKQAIYRFRGADINAYRAAAQTADCIWEMGENWRSDRRYVDALNHVFEQTPDAFETPGVDYVRVDAARDDRVTWPGDTPPALELRVVERGNRRAIYPGAATELLTRLVAADIAALLDEPPQLQPPDEAPRTLECRDVAVLVRTNRQAALVQAALVARGVPAVRFGSDDVMASDEAETLYQLLDAVLEPTDRGAVRRAFATPLVGMRAPDLYRLESEPDAWQTEVEQLRTLRELWLEHGPARLFRELLARYQWPGKLLATDDGPRALTNLLHLSDVLQGWALSERLGPAGLMRRFRAARDAATEEGATGLTENEARQLRLESDADAVRVVTMHSAKGLEYPFVYAPFLWQGSGLGAVERRVLRGNDPDPPYAPYLDLSVTLDQPPKQDRIEATDAALRAEGMRLLYVAITRARHRAVVYHIAARGAQHGPLARLIYDGVVQFQRRSDERLATEARRLTDGCDHADVSLAEPPEPQSAPEAPEVRLPSVRSFHPHWLDHWWRRGSFSQLKKGDVMPDPGPDGEGVDHEDDDDDTPAALPVATPTDAPDVPLAGLEASRRFGDCVHDILEHAPFDAGDDGLRPWATRYAARYGYAAEVVDPLVAGLLVALDTPLGPGESPLSSVPMTDRLNELHFDFSVAGGQAPIKSSRVTNRNLAAVLRRHLDPAGPVPTTYADAVGRLRFFPLQGFMTGDIDLVFRHGDRWWLVDHKTSRLGPKPADYAPARLQAHMAARHYVLQYHLYVVALHRWLSVRLLDYDYDRDFGGVRYLYLRGMCGPAGSGVFADRPPRALVEALDALFTDPAAMEADG